MHRCFIFGALPVKKLFERPEKDDLVIAADKGFDEAVKLGFLPDILIGDFDSIKREPDFENKIRLNVRKDDTDIEHAINFAMNKGYDRFIVYGAVGGLLDHTFANIQLASLIADRHGRSVFYGNDESFTVVKNSSFGFSKRDKGRVSVFALSQRCEGVNISGLSYEAENLTLERRVPTGVSNEFIGKDASISVERGELLIIWQT